MQCCWLNWRDVESYGHGRAQQDDVAPEDEEPRVNGVAANHQRSQNPCVAHDPTGKHAAADGKEQSSQQHGQDDLEIQNIHTHNLQ